MHMKFTNLFELIYEEKKILEKVNELIKKSQFVGGEEVAKFEDNFKKYVKSI